MKHLIIIDMQNDFVTGSLGTDEAKSIVKKVTEKFYHYLKRGDRVTFTQDTHQENYLDTAEGLKLPIPHCIKGTNGHDIIPELELPNGFVEGPVTFIEKETFGYANWSSVVSPDEDIEIVGVCTDICVISNALILKALYPEASITVDASCCAGVTPDLHQKALDVMRSCQINIINE